MLKVLINLFLTLCLITNIYAQEYSPEIKKNYDILKSKPSASYLFDRFYNSFLEIHDSETLEIYLKNKLNGEATSDNILILATYYNKENKLSLALDLFNSITEEKLLTSELLYFWAKLEIKNNEPDEAIEHIEIAINQANNNSLKTELYKLKAKAYLVLGDTEMAQTVLDNVKKINANDKYILEDILELQIKENLIFEAKKTCEELLNNTSDNYEKTMIRLRLSSILVMLENYTDAQKILVELIDDTGDESWLLKDIFTKIESIYNENNDKDGLIKKYEELIKNKPKNIALLKRCAYLKLQNNDKDGALTIVKNLTELLPSNQEIIISYVNLLRECEKFSEALVILEPICKTNLEIYNYENIFLLAETYFENKNKIQANQQLKIYITKPNISEFELLRAGQLIEKYEDIKDQIIFFENVANKFYEYFGLKEYLIELYLQNKQSEKAISVSRALNIKNDLDINLRLTALFVKKQLFLEAENILESLNSNLKENSSYLTAKINIKKNTRNTNDILPLLIKKLDLSNTKVEIKESIQDFIEQIDNENINSYCNVQIKKQSLTIKEALLLCYYYLYKHEVSNVTELLNKFKSEALNHQQISEIFIELLIACDEKEKAIQLLKDNISKYPHLKNQLNIQLHALLINTEQLNSATEIAKEIVSKQPTVENYILQANTEVKKGQLNEAIKITKKAINQFKIDKSLKIYLSELYSSNNNKDQAHNTLWMAIEETNDINEKIFLFKKILDDIEPYNVELKDLIDLIQSRTDTDAKIPFRYLALLECYKMQGDIDSYNKYVHELILLNSVDAKSLIKISKILIENMYLKDAENILIKAATIDKTNNAKLELSFFYLKYDKFEKGMSILNTLKSSIFSESDILNFADLLIENRKNNFAYYLLNNITPISPTFLYKYYLAYLAYCTQKPEAESLLLDLLKIDSQKLPIYDQDPEYFIYNGADSLMQKIKLFSDIEYEIKKETISSRFISNINFTFCNYSSKSQSSRQLYVPNDLDECRFMALALLKKIYEKNDDTTKRRILSQIKKYNSIYAYQLLTQPRKAQEPENEYLSKIIDSQEICNGEKLYLKIIKNNESISSETYINIINEIKNLDKIRQIEISNILIGQVNNINENAFVEFEKILNKFNLSKKYITNLHTSIYRYLLTKNSSNNILNFKIRTLAESVISDNSIEERAYYPLAIMLNETNQHEYLIQFIATILNKKETENDETKIFVQIKSILSKGDELDIFQIIRANFKNEISYEILKDLNVELKKEFIKSLKSDYLKLYYNLIFTFSEDNKSIIASIESKSNKAIDLLIISEYYLYIKNYNKAIPLLMQFQKQIKDNTTANRFNWYIFNRIIENKKHINNSKFSKSNTTETLPTDLISESDADDIAKAILRNMPKEKLKKADILEIAHHYNNLYEFEEVEKLISIYNKLNSKRQTNKIYLKSSNNQNQIYNMIVTAQFDNAFVLILNNAKEVYNDSTLTTNIDEEKLYDLYNNLDSIKTFQIEPLLLNWLKKKDFSKDIKSLVTAIAISKYFNFEELLRKLTKDLIKLDTQNREYILLFVAIYGPKDELFTQEMLNKLIEDADITFEIIHEINSRGFNIPKIIEFQNILEIIIEKTNRDFLLSNQLGILMDAFLIEINAYENDQKFHNRLLSIFYNLKLKIITSNNECIEYASAINEYKFNCHAKYEVEEIEILSNTLEHYLDNSKMINTNNLYIYLSFELQFFINLIKNDQLNILKSSLKNKNNLEKIQNKINLAQAIISNTMISIESLNIYTNETIPADLVAKNLLNFLNKSNYQNKQTNQLIFLKLFKAYIYQINQNHQVDDLRDNLIYIINNWPFLEKQKFLLDLEKIILEIHPNLIEDKNNNEISLNCMKIFNNYDLYWLVYSLRNQSALFNKYSQQIMLESYPRYYNHNNAIEFGLFNENINQLPFNDECELINNNFKISIDNFLGACSKLEVDTIFEKYKDNLSLNLMATIILCKYENEECATYNLLGNSIEQFNSMTNRQKFGLGKLLNTNLAHNSPNLTTKGKIVFQDLIKIMKTESELEKKKFFSYTSKEMQSYLNKDTLKKSLLSLVDSPIEELTQYMKKYLYAKTLENIENNTSDKNYIGNEILEDMFQIYNINDFQTLKLYIQVSEILNLLDINYKKINEIVSSIIINNLKQELQIDFKKAKSRNTNKQITLSNNQALIISNIIQSNFSEINKFVNQSFQIDLDKLIDFMNANFENSEIIYNYLLGKLSKDNATERCFKLKIEIILKKDDSANYNHFYQILIDDSQNLYHRNEALKKLKGSNINFELKEKIIKIELEILKSHKELVSDINYYELIETVNFYSIEQLDKNAELLQLLLINYIDQIEPPFGYFLSGYLHGEKRFYLLKELYKTAKAQKKLCLFRNTDFIDNLLRDTNELIELIINNQGEIILDLSMNGLLLYNITNKLPCKPITEEELNKILLFSNKIKHPIIKNNLILFCTIKGVINKQNEIEFGLFCKQFNAFLKDELCDYKTNLRLIPLIIYNNFSLDENIANNLNSLVKKISLKNNSARCIEEEQVLLINQSMMLFNQIKSDIQISQNHIETSKLFSANYIDFYHNTIFDFLFYRAIADEKPEVCFSKIQNTFDAENFQIKINFEVDRSAWLLINLINNKKINDQYLQKFESPSKDKNITFNLAKFIELLNNLSYSKFPMNQNISIIVNNLCESKINTYFDASDVDFDSFDLSFIKDVATKEKLHSFILSFDQHQKN